VQRSSFPYRLTRPVVLRDLLAQVPPPLDLVGDDGIEISSVAPLDLGVSGSLVFSRFKGADSVARVLNSKASVAVCAEPMKPVPGRTFLHVEDPRGWFIDALEVLLEDAPRQGIDPRAQIADGASIGANVSVGPGTVIEDGASVSENCVIGSHCFIGAAATLDAGVKLASHVSIGCSGLAFHERPDGRRAYFRHLGRVFVGAGSSVGTHSTLMRGIIDDTVIGERAMIGNHVNVGHNCIIGDDAYISSGSVLAGASSVGSGAILGAGVRLSSHIRVGADAMVGIGSVVVKDVEDGRRVFGNPAKPLATMRRF